jgi:hypothetical protein
VRQAKLQYSCLLHAGFLLDLLFNSEDGGNTFFQNITEFLLDYTASYPKRQYASNRGHRLGGQAYAPSWIFGGKNINLNPQNIISPTSMPRSRMMELYLLFPYIFMA